MKKDKPDVDENVQKSLKKVLESERLAKLFDPMYGNDIPTPLDEMQVNSGFKFFERLKDAIPGFSVTISDASKRIDEEWYGRWTYTVKDCNGDRLFSACPVIYNVI